MKLKSLGIDPENGLLSACHLKTVNFQIRTAAGQKLRLALFGRVSEAPHFTWSGRRIHLLGKKLPRLATGTLDLGPK
jgi:hypothetical protein